jgi:hypothetical protein
MEQNFIRKVLLVFIFLLHAGLQGVRSQTMVSLDTLLPPGSALFFNHNGQSDHRNDRQLRLNYFPYTDSAFRNFCSAYVPLRESLDTLSFRNPSAAQPTTFYFFLNQNRVMHLDSLVEDIFAGCSSTEEKAWAVYQYVRDHHLYYFAVDKADPIAENYNASKFLNAYGIGNCGMIANTVSQLVARYTGQNQRHWFINMGAHGISEVKFDSTWVMIDADEDGIYLLPDNRAMGSLYDVFMDSQHYLRSKHFGEALPYRYDWNLYFNDMYRWGGHYINNTDSNLNLPEPCCPKLNGLMGDHVQITLRPLSTVRYLPNDSLDALHFVHTEPAPSDTTVLFNIGKGQLESTFAPVNATPAAGFASVGNLSVLPGDSLYAPGPGGQGEWVIREDLPYPINRARLFFSAQLQAPGDSIRFWFSRDSLTWIPVPFSPSAGGGMQPYSLDLLDQIKPNTDAAVYRYYLRCRMVESPMGTCRLQGLQLISQFQYNKLSGPRLERGSNRLRYYASGLQPLEVRLRWREEQQLHPPFINIQNIFPADSSVLDSTAFTFRWTVPGDPDGDSIVDYHIQISTRSDMKYPVSTLHDRYLKLTNGGQAEFRPEVSDYYLHNGTYYWRVRAQDASGLWSDWSAVHPFTVKTPLHPRNLRWEMAGDTLQDILRLRWNANNLGDTADYFKVYGSGNTLGFEALDSKFYGNTLSTDIPVHFPTGRKRFRVRACKANGTLSASSYFINLPLAKTALLGSSFNYLDTFQNNLYCNIQPFPPVNLDERPLFYIVSHPNRIAVNGNTLTAIDTGRVLIDICTRVHSDTVRLITAYVRIVNGLPAPASKPTLLIWAKDTQSVYGNAAVHNGFQYVGFAPNHNSNTLLVKPSMLPGADSTSDAGYYPLQPGGAQTPLYNVVYQPGILQILQRPVTLSAKDTSVPYGSAISVWPFSVQGLVNGDTPNDLQQQPQMQSPWTPQSLPGQYTLQPFAAADPNYLITQYLPGQITVTKAPLQVVPVSSTSVYGTQPVPAGLNYTGFVNGEGPGILQNTPVISIAADSLSHTGIYPSLAAGGISDRYQFQYGSGVHEIVKAPLTVICNDTQTVYGQTPVSNGYQLLGLMHDDTPDSLQVLPQINVGASALSHAGTYAISAGGGADPNYSFSYTDGVLSILKAPLLVIPADTQVEYGDLPAGFQASLQFAGFNNGDGPAQLDTLPQTTVPANAQTFPGTYPILCSGGADDDYHYIYDSASLIITKAPLTITAQAGSSVYGEVPLALPLLYQGFKGSDGPASLSTLPQVTVAADQYSPPGTYPIQFSTPASAQQYQPMLITSQHTVSKRPLSAQASDLNIYYRDTVGALPYVLSGLVNGDQASGIDQLPVPQTTYRPDSLAGDYPITFSAGFDDRYTITTQGATLRVRPTLPAVSLTGISLQNRLLHYGVRIDDHGGQLNDAGIQLAQAKSGFSMPNTIPLEDRTLLAPPYFTEYTDQVELNLENEELLLRAYAFNEAGTVYSDTVRLANFDQHYLQVIHVSGQEEVRILCGKAYLEGYADLRAADGRVVYRQRLNSNHNFYRFPHLPAGLYFLSASDRNGKMLQTKKLFIR